MINKNMLRGKIAAAGLTQKELSLRIGMSENTLSAKISGASRFYVDEIERICTELGIVDPSEKAEIFLNRMSK